MLLVTIDCLRADRCGIYGYERETTPHLDALAREAVVFERAYAQAPFTAPSHASLFTGLHTQSHGVLHWSSQLDLKAVTMAELFASEGYATGAFFNHPSLPATGVLRGFETARRRVLEPWQLSVGDFFEWVDGRDTQRQPFAAWVHLWDVHRPYGYRDWSLDVWRTASGRGPNELRLAFGEKTKSQGGFRADGDARVGRFEEHYNLNPSERAGPLPLGGEQRRFQAADFQAIDDRYDNGVSYADQGLGALVLGLRERGLLEDMVLVVTADHGEALREREGCWFTHDPYLFEETLHVPLVMRLPGAEHGGKRVGELARGIDILPTFLDLAGLGGVSGPQGRSLMPDVRGEAREPAVLFAQTQTVHAKEDDRKVEAAARESGQSWVEHRLALIEGNHKLIRDLDTGTDLLFDLAQDPHELRDLVAGGEHQAVHARLVKLLEKLIATLPTSGQDPRDLPCDQRRVLVELGYLDPSALDDC